MGFLLLLVYTGTPGTIFDRNSLKLFTSKIIKGIFQKLYKRGLGPNMLPWQQKNMFLCSSRLVS